MPKRTDIKSILVIGAGPIVIGQACEFDYSGTQGCKALKAEGYRVILINSNPATIMTDLSTADAVYVEPITADFVEQVIAKERPDALLPTLGGQTALNTSLELYEKGILEKYNVQMIGVKPEAIAAAEDRKKFAKCMEEIGLKCPKNIIACSIEEALNGLKHVGLPAIIRPSYTLGGSGGGVANNMEEYLAIVKSGLEASPITQVLIDQSVIGWKEYEMEVVRDKNDNAIIICSIENLDPMGVHTGDSITVAPALTLTDKEYQYMRTASLEVLRKIGVETGGSNVQFAVNPSDGEVLVIEMNPRVSRSSALASKATGFPIAKIAAKLAVGYTLDELDNDITKTTPASFEPTIDYIVVKVPRFAFDKFGGYSDDKRPLLSTAMKSVGEVMSIGGNFKEALNKAFRSLETGLYGFESQKGKRSKDELLTLISKPIVDRILFILEALEVGASIKEVQDATKYDPWFLTQIKEMAEQNNELRANGIDKAKETSWNFWYHLKRNGYSNKQIEKLCASSKNPISLDKIEAALKALKILPTYKKIDTCAAEFAANANYIYSTYSNNKISGTDAKIPQSEAAPTDKKKVIVVGSGPNRIGQGIEFDYSCVRAIKTIREEKIESIMVNCNPETVSTDYDTSDRLYFDAITIEDLSNIYKRESENGEVLGVILQFGGQTPLKISKDGAKYGINILGTSQDSIDIAEDRDRFRLMLEEIKLRQPKSASYKGKLNEETINEIDKIATKIGYPVLIRPSYVIGGERMRVVENKQELSNYISSSSTSDLDLLIDKFLTQAIEVDADVVRDSHGNSMVAGVMQHIEEAGVHSGDSACCIPPFSLSKETIQEIEIASVLLAEKLNVVGLMNVQFAVGRDSKLYVLEVNPRASRTVPFVAKAVNLPVIDIATRSIITGRESVKEYCVGHKEQCLLRKTATGKDYWSCYNISYYAVKEVVFPFDKFETSDTILGPEMKSTGEVIGVDFTPEKAFAKAQIAAKMRLPSSGKIFISLRDEDKSLASEIAEIFVKSGFEIIATEGTAKAITKDKAALQVETVKKVSAGSPNIVDMMLAGNIAMVINTTSKKQSVVDSFSIRRTAITRKIPYTTTIDGARFTANTLLQMSTENKLTVKSLQEWGVIKK